MIYQLMRLDKPIGIVLLWAPTAWGLWLAAHGMPPLLICMYFFLGVVCMRSAGCIVNDLADRNIDGHVLRTRNRPLATGEVSVYQALLWLLLLLSAAVLILLQLPRACWYVAIVSLLLTGVYPLTKRFFQAPQLLLGLAFASSIPMAYLALHKPLTLTCWLLILINVCWTVAYDTMYAMVDLQDDLRIGVLSTARLFGIHVRCILRLLLLLAQVLWLMIALINKLDWPFYMAFVIATMLLLYQQNLIVKNEYFRAFMNNAWYGLVMWVGLVAALLL